MLGIKLVCVGRLREAHYTAAAAEYSKRLGAFCKLETDELSEARLPAEPSQAELEAALLKEAVAIGARLPKGGYTVALCVEGEALDSAGLAGLVSELAVGGCGKLGFVIGGSNGLHPSVKRRADRLLSMSRMTFPHHLARVMLLEQLYRAFKIIEGSKYHK